MKQLPFLLSVPHAGQTVPNEVKDICLLRPDEIMADSDEGAGEIYAVKSSVVQHITTPVARAIVDLNRAPDDIGNDGVIKSHTCWQVPVYDGFPNQKTIKQLLKRYYFPYHEALTHGSNDNMIILGIDCHTMNSVGPPVGPDAGKERPWICLSDAGGACPRPWIESLATSFRKVFGNHVSINDPFKGGFITKTHGREMPWVQLEISRASFISNEEKRTRLLSALEKWLEEL